MWLEHVRKIHKEVLVCRVSSQSESRSAIVAWRGVAGRGGGERGEGGVEGVKGVEGR